MLDVHRTDSLLETLLNLVLSVANELLEVDGSGLTDILIVTLTVLEHLGDLLWCCLGNWLDTFGTVHD